MNYKSDELKKSSHTKTLNVIKFILITLVVIDHNELFRLLWPKVFDPLTFHVVGFFLLSFSFDKKVLSVQFVKDRVARYLVPFWWVLTIATIGNYFILKEISLSDASLNYMLAFFIGSAATVKVSSGLYMLWFLPCLFGLTCLMAFLDSFDNKLMQLLIWFLAIILHLSLPFFIGSWISWIPIGLPVVAFIYLLGLIWRKIILQSLSNLKGFISLVIFLISYSTLVDIGVHIEIGTLEVIDLKIIFYTILNIIVILSSAITIIWISKNLIYIKWVDFIGKNSLLIYLLHPFIYFLINKKINLYLVSEINSYILFLSATMVTILVIASSGVLASIIGKYPPLSYWFIPKTWATWPPAVFLSKLK